MWFSFAFRKYSFKKYGVTNMLTVITTTGTSLLINTARDLNKKNHEVTEEDLRHFFERVNTEKACAETNSLGKIADNRDEVILLYTSTKEGEMCAKVIASKLKKEGWTHIKLRQLYLEENEVQFECKGLRELVNTLIEEITKAQRLDRKVIINATGGFKAEVAYTTMVGMIFQVPVKYIYQFFKNPITFPVLPITWNTDLLLGYEYFFSWIDREPRKNFEVEQRLNHLPDREAISALLLPPDNDDEVFLSPAGQILWSRFKKQKEDAEEAEEPPVSEITNSQDKISSSLQYVKHHYPKNTLKFAEKVASLAAVESVIGGCFENTTLKRIKHVGEDGLIKILWADNDKAVNIAIQTTAKGKAQTMKVASLINPLLKN
jgi:putative CRISPR-associated protein (TIGR02619 family)